MNTNGFIPEHGGFKKLKSYQKAVVVYDATLAFCARFHRGNRRQVDQMEQAARSGKQNIIEGSLASATSKRTEVHLTKVAKASLDELLEDYGAFLRTGSLPVWKKDHPEARRITRRARLQARSTEAPSSQSSPSSRSSPPPRACTECGVSMVRRTARRGPNAGNPFWGCRKYPPAPAHSRCRRTERTKRTAKTRAESRCSSATAFRLA